MHALAPPVRVTAPASRPVTLQEVKAHCRIDFTDEDTLVSSYVDAAIAHVEGWSGILGRCLVTQTWRQTTWRWFEPWPSVFPVKRCNPSDLLGDCRSVRLAFPDVSAVVITYIDENGATQTVDAAHYEILHDAIGSVVRFKPEFPAPTVAELGDAIRYQMTVGYGAASAVPAAIKTAISMLVAHWYNNREAAVAENMSEMPFAVMTLLAPYRRAGV